MPDSRAYPKFGSIPRWYKDFVITEKVDGSNGLIAVIEDDYEIDQVHTPLAVIDGKRIYAGSRNRWLEAEKSKDNAGFAAWVQEHAEDAAALGPGLHYGEWYGKGIQRGYGLTDKRFALFNVSRWGSDRPSSFDSVPVLWQGSGDDIHQGIEDSMIQLDEFGSRLVPGFRQPEGIVIYSLETNKYWKKTLVHDRIPKDLVSLVVSK